MSLQTLTIRTSSHTALVDITSEVRNVVRRAGVESGLLVVYVPHTTAGITLNENADPTVRGDILADLARLVPENQAYYRHREGNSPSHSKASVVGNSLTMIVEEGEILLGTWQGIFLAEFDGPRARRVHVKLLSEG